MITLPEAFEQEMKQLLGEEEYEAYRKTFDEAVHRGLRVNNGKISTEEFLRRTDIPLKKVPWIPNGFYYDEESCNPAKDADYYAGLYYLQEPSAMTPASRLPIEPDDRVLDLCAAPGGKATELGSRIGEGGMLLANDISNSRAKALLRNLEIQGVGRLLVTSEDPEKLVTLYPAFFDKPIRWLVDDCTKFVEREIRRGNHYDAIIMDPPSYGRGPKGEIWKIEESIHPFIRLCTQLLSDDPLFFLVNSYTTGLAPAVLTYMISLELKQYKGHVEAQEIGLPVKSTGLVLPCGASGRWQSDNV